MDFWQKAKGFAEGAAKRSQELTMEAAKRSQDLTIGSSKISDIVSETTRRSKEIAAEASKRADQIKLEAMRGADKLKSFADQLPGGAISLVDSAPSPFKPAQTQPADLEAFGVTEELREFVKGITSNTFREFPLEDDTEMSDVPTVSNVRQDLTEWQAKHASLVLSSVKEISKLRYELCPRVMKERKFWRIYFILVNTHVAPFEKQYVEELKLKSAEESKDERKKEASEGATSESEQKEVKQQSKTSSSTEQDLDVFLLGDLGESDDGQDDADGGFDDDFDKIDSSDDERK